jgi:hypothetical protein
MTRIAIGFAALVAALAAAGCGGGGGSLTKQQYAARLNQICAGYSAAVRKIGRPSSLAQLATRGPALLSGFDRAIDQAAKLKPPKELKADAEQFVAEAKQVRDALAGLIDAVRKRDAARAAQLAARAEALAKDSARLARSLGAPACAQT